MAAQCDCVRTFFPSSRRTRALRLYSTLSLLKEYWMHKDDNDNNGSLDYLRSPGLIGGLGQTEVILPRHLGVVVYNEIGHKSDDLQKRKSFHEGHKHVTSNLLNDKGRSGQCGDRKEVHTGRGVTKRIIISDELELHHNMEVPSSAFEGVEKGEPALYDEILVRDSCRPHQQRIHVDKNCAYNFRRVEVLLHHSKLNWIVLKHGIIDDFKAELFIPIRVQSLPNCLCSLMLLSAQANIDERVHSGICINREISALNYLYLY
jgi:hypothetical protein